jgi:hypothetical protein
MSALLFLFVFSLQSYFIATHIHPPSVGQIVASGGHSHSPAPIDKENPDDCPICQAVALAGSFIVPAIIVLPIAVLVTDVAPPAALASSLASRHRHSWQSRAPPV